MLKEIVMNHHPSRDSHLRSVLKGITWRLIGTMDTLLLSYIFTGNLKIAAAISATEVFTKILLYYLHERVWQLAPPGSIRKSYRIGNKKSE